MHHTFFFFNDTATTEIYTLSLHDALPIFKDRELEMYERAFFAPTDGDAIADAVVLPLGQQCRLGPCTGLRAVERHLQDRKSTRLNSSYQIISYAVFCLKKKKKNSTTQSYG